MDITFEKNVEVELIQENASADFLTIEENLALTKAVQNKGINCDEMKIED